MINQDIALRLISPRRYGTVAQTPTAPQEALQNVVIAELFDGTMCIVGNTPAGPGGLFALSKASAIPVDGLNILPTFTGVGRWIRIDAAGLPAQARASSIWDQFGAVSVPGGTQEAGAVVLDAIPASVVTILGYDDNYYFDAEVTLQALGVGQESDTMEAGIKFQWDLDGDGTYETEGARTTSHHFGLLAYDSFVMRERRLVPYASLGTILIPRLRVVGWDTAFAGGWQTAVDTTEVGPIHPNTLSFTFSHS